MAASESIQIGRYSLLYSVPATEKEFLRSRTDRLVSAFILATIIFSILVTLNLVQDHIYLSKHPSVVSLVKWKTWYFVGTAAFMVPFIFVLCRATAEIRERMVLFLLCPGAALSFLFDYHYLAQFLGYDPYEIFPTPCDRNCFNHHLIMMLLCYVTYTHFLLNLRWVALLVFDVATVLIIAPCLFLLGPRLPGDHTEALEGHILTFVIFLFLIWSCALGARRSELHERRNFANLIAERTLRFQAEFQLARLPPIREENSTESHSETSSVPSSTVSGRLMQRLPGQSYCSFLETVAAFGRAEQWMLDSDELAIDHSQVLGRGGFGIVCKGTFHGAVVAIKLPRYREVSTRSEKFIYSLCNEIRVLRRLRNPHIVGLHGVVLDPKNQKIVLVLEYIQGVSLGSFIGRHGVREANPIRCQVSIDVCCALRYLHSRTPCVVHGDLSCRNIMIEHASHMPRAKLLDFGLSVLRTRRSQRAGGTLRWMPPDQSVNPASDIFSFGRVIFYIACGILPLKNVSDKEIARALRNAVVLPLHWPGIDPFELAVRHVVEDCNRLDMFARPTANHVHEQLECILSSLNQGEQVTEKLPSEKRHVPESQYAIKNAPEGTDAARDQTRPETIGKSSDLLVPEFLVTPASTRKLVAVHALRRCNAPRRIHQCCEFHGGVEALLETCDMLQRCPCHESFFYDINVQCRRCGGMFHAIDDKSDSCDMCLDVLESECNADDSTSGETTPLAL